MFSYISAQGQHTRKTSRTFTLVRRLGWIITFLVGVGGQFIPKLGLLVPFLMVGMMIMSMFTGKYWCGNFCPHGSYFDNLVQKISSEKKIPAVFRSRWLIASVLLFFLFNMGRRFLAIYGGMGTNQALDRIGFVFANTYLMVILAGTLLGILFSSRTWCRICPMGTMQAGLYKMGQHFDLHRFQNRLVTLTEPERCRGCGLCSQVCPIQLEPHQEFHADGTFQHADCIRCQTCVQNCPMKILNMEKKNSAAS